MKTVIGIDPGQTGGIVVISEEDIYTLAMPVSGKEIDVVAIDKFIMPHIIPADSVVAYIEKVHSMPQQGVSSTFKFGYSVGILHGVIRMMYIPLNLVTPQLWKKEILAGTAKDKQAAADYCARVYPKVNLLATERSRKPHSGIVDALCIAEYGWKQENYEIR